jgi:hypothetical protein
MVPGELTRTIDPRIECAGILGKLFGHRFEARHDEVENVELLTRLDAAAKIPRSALIRDVYVHDVCVRCGCVVHRGQGEAR